MNIEQKKDLLKLAKKNYVIVRDEDGEILCLISAEDWWYSAYTFEQYVLLKEDIYKILDKAAWVSIIDKVDENIASNFIPYEYKGDEIWD